MSDHVIISQDFEASPEIAEFAKAFPKAQSAMGDVLKNANNPAFKSKYADLAAVVEATIPALNSAGFSVLQFPSFNGSEVRVATLILHESGQWMRCTLALRPTKADPQGVGSATTYARRYGLQAMTGVAPEDDDGNAASRPNGQHQPANTGPRISREQADELAVILEDAGADIGRFCSFMQVPTLSDIPANRFDAAMNAAQAKLKKAAA